MRQKAVDEFLLDVADEEGGVPEPHENDNAWPEWSGYVRNAWHALRDDRFYGSMGGIGSIYYTAISRYAEDHGIPLHPFATFISAMDDEYLVYFAEKNAEKINDTD